MALTLRPQMQAVPFGPQEEENDVEMDVSRLQGLHIGPGPLVGILQPTNAPNLTQLMEWAQHLCQIGQTVVSIRACLTGNMKAMQITVGLDTQ